MTPLRRLGSTIAVTLLALVTVVAVSPHPALAESVLWLCRPGQSSPDCGGDLTTTVQHADGTSDVQRPQAARNPKVDCFYVYPTASQQPRSNAERTKEASVRAVARQQVSRFSTTCRVWAPLYRQRTLIALSSEMATTPAQKAAYNKTAYADVLTAWRAFLAAIGPDRGFVLIGHSQGSRLLRKLIRDQIDPRPALRHRMVSAILPGADVLVRRGSDRGGDFRHVRVCQRRTQTGCVLAWSTFGQAPPDDTRFGTPPTAPDESVGLGLPFGRQYAVACTNPASLADNRRRPLRSLFRTEPFPGILGALLLAQYNGDPPSADTAWVRPAERYSARCETVNSARVLTSSGWSRRALCPDDVPVVRPDHLGRPA